MSTVPPPPTSSARRPASAAEIAGVAFLCVLALVLRLRGIGHLLPVMPLSDSVPIVQQVDALRGKGEVPGTEGSAAFYPMLLARATALLPDPAADAGRARTLEEHLRLASEPWRQIRLVSVLLSILVVPGTWLLARRFLAGPWPLLAAAFVATSLLHVVFSSQEKPHGPLASFVVLAALAALRVRERGDVLACLAFGTATALAIGALHSGVFAIAMLPAALLLRERREGRASAWWSVAALALIGLSLPAFYPFPLGGGAGGGASSSSTGVLDVSGHLISLDRFRGRGFAVMGETLWSYDPALLLASALALAALFRRRPATESRRTKDVAVLLAFALPYILVFGMYDYNLERFVIPLLPFLACLGAWALSRFVPPLAAAALPALALVPAWKLGSVRAVPDTYARAAECVAKAATPDADPIVVVPYLDLPLLHGERALSENSRFPWRSNWVRYQLAVDPSLRIGPRYEVFVCPKSIEEAGRALREDPIGYFREYGARYVVLGVEPEPGGVLTKVREAVRASADLVCRISPEAEDSGRSVGFLYRHINDPERRPFFLFVMQMQSTGGTLEVYRLR